MHEVQSEVPQIFQYAWLIILLPFIGVLVNLFGGKSRSEKTIGWTAVIFSGLAFVVALAVILALGNLPEEVRLHGVNVPGYTFFSIGSLSVEFGLHIDELTSVMLMVVTLVGTLDPRLRHRLHARRQPLPALLHLPQPLHGDDVDPGAGEQLPDVVRGLGRRGRVLVPIDRLLVREGRQRQRGQESDDRQSRGRLGRAAGDVRHAHRSGDAAIPRRV